MREQCHIDTTAYQLKMIIILNLADMGKMHLGTRLYLGHFHMLRLGSVADTQRVSLTHMAAPHHKM